MSNFLPACLFWGEKINFETLRFSEKHVSDECQNIEDKNLTRPLNYHNRTGHKLTNDKCQLQDRLSGIKKFADDNQLLINEKKTKIIMFNKSQKFAFMPEFSICGDKQLEVVEELKLLGLTLTSDLSWQTHVDNICKKAYANLWMITRLKNLGASSAILLDLYSKFVRSSVEYAVPACPNRENTKKLL